VKLYRVLTSHQTFRIVTAKSIVKDFDTHLIFDQAIDNKAYSSDMWP
jgi:hypothetical protein